MQPMTEILRSLLPRSGATSGAGGGDRLPSDVGASFASGFLCMGSQPADLLVREDARTSSLPRHEAFTSYGRELSQWLRGEGSDERALEDAGRRLCSVAHAYELRPEELLVLLHRHGIPPRDVAHSEYRNANPGRYTRAVRLLLRAYFSAELSQARLA